MTLDPVDWTAARATGRRMVDDMLSWQESIRDRPPWQPVPLATKHRLDEPVPYAGMPLDEIYDAFVRDVLPYPTGNIHPRFWGWVMGTGTPTGMLAEMLAAGMNSHVAGYDQSASTAVQSMPNDLVHLALTQDRLNRYFNTDAFAVNEAFHYGDVPRYFGYLRGPGQANTNLAVMKNTVFGER